MTKRTGGGRILVDQLQVRGCDPILAVPGEISLAMLDEMRIAL